MAEIKNNFLKGKMDKDINPKLIANGSYREAQNASVSESESDRRGALQNILGNKLAYNSALGLGSDVECIGYCLDRENDRVFWFVTDFEAEDTGDIRTMARASSNVCRIIHHELNGTTSPTTIVSGDFLNFNKKKLITGANIVDDLLFWTDDYNQPRRINVAKAIEQTTYYDSEDKISLAKVAPYAAPLLVEHQNLSVATTTRSLPSNNTSIESDYLREKFVRFSYRYIYEDNEESIMAPFTQTVFRPLNSATISNSSSNIHGEAEMVKRGVNNMMQNDLNDITIRIPLPFDNDLQTEDGDSIHYITPTQSDLTTNVALSSSTSFYYAFDTTPTLFAANEYIIKGIDSTSITNDITRAVVTLDDAVNQFPYTFGGSDVAFIEGNGLTCDAGNKFALVSMWRNKVGLKKIQVLIKESDDAAVRILSEINVSGFYTSERKTSFEDKIDVYPVKPASSGDIYWRYCYVYNYKSERPYKALPEADITRVNDTTPVRARSQELVSNRLVFGNFVENYNLPVDEAGNKGINYRITDSTKGDIENSAGINNSSGILQHLEKGYLYNSIKQNRTYQVGVVLMDKYGRESPVILSTNPNLDVYTNTTDTFTVPAITTDFSSYFNELVGDITTNQTSFVTGTYVSPSFTTSGSGTSGAFTVAVGSSGSVTSVEVTSAGSGYLAGDTITITNAALGGSTVGEDLVITLSDDGLKGYSWTQEQRNVFGLSMQIDFRDSRIVPSSEVYSTSNPHGWYAWKLVVKQTEQEYYNVYVTHVVDQGTASDDPSWLLLRGDNINKVPREINDEDINRVGVSGSDARLFPKVIHGTSGSSVMAAVATDEEYIDVVAIGTAREFGLYADNASTLSETPAYNGHYTNYVNGWVPNGQDNPLLAELPNMDTIYSNNNDGTAANPSAGLSVFETKPFESLLDVYYETSTSGLVSDINSYISESTTGPADIEWATNAGTLKNLAENTSVGSTIGSIEATPVSPGTDNEEFEVISFIDGNGNDVSNNISVSLNTATSPNQGTVKVDGNGFYFANSTNDTHKLTIRVIDDQGAYSYQELTIKITNSAPSVSIDSSYDASIASPIGIVVIDNGTFNNGAIRSNKKYSGVQLALTFPNVTNSTTRAQYESMFTINKKSNGNFEVKTTSAFETYISSFSSATASERTMTITATDNGGLTATDTSQINTTEGRVAFTSTLGATSSELCSNVASGYNIQTVWIAAGSGSLDTSGNIINIGNILYTDEFGTNTVGNGLFTFLSNAKYATVSGGAGVVASTSTLVC